MNIEPTRKISAWKLAAVTAAAWLWLAGSALGAQSAQPLRVDGMEIFFGLIPAEIMLGHPAEHAERSMHGSVPVWGEQYHLIVSLFDQASGKRIHDAEIEARVFDMRGSGKLAGQRKRLEPMLFASTASYGNYFNMPAPAPYRIELEIRRAGARESVKIPIEYRHALVTTNPRP